jgi:sugar lactone lactonase YvrE
MLLNSRYAISFGVAAALALAGCSNGSQTVPGQPSGLGAAANNGVIGTPRHQAARAPSTGWLNAQAKAGTALLYVADQSNQRVAIFSQKSGAPVGQITDAISGPDGLYVDPSGTLYVCNFGAGTVTEYPKGQTTHSKTLTGPTSPKYVVAGHDGTVYAADFNGSFGGKVYEYAGGSTTPTTEIPFSTFPAGLALDRHNKLYVAYNDSNNLDIEVLKFTPGKTTGKNLGIHIKSGYAGGLTFDKSGNLLVDNQNLPGVEVFPPGATTPSQQITGFSLAYQIALNHANKKLYVSNPFGPSVAVVSYPSGTIVGSISSGLSGAFGVATSPDSPY